jgi:hypothetical protein
MPGDMPNWTGEQELCAALIEDAIKVLKDTAGVHSYSAQVARAEERAWFQSESVEFGSFELCAQHLNLDAEALRVKALKI